MAQFDPKLRIETWVMQEVAKDAKQRPTFRRLGFNLVEYDGNPDRYIEPRPLADRYDPSLSTRDAKLLDPVNDGRRMVGIEIQTGQRHNEVHQFD